jgi:hypothetical protein
LNAPATIVPSVRYSEAPTCLFPLTRSNSMSDDEGRLWSMMGGKECVFRPAAAAIPKPIVLWHDAPACEEEPTENNSVVDDNGRLWGWQDNASCAFKRSNDALPSSAASTGSAARMAASSSRSSTAGRVSVVWEAAPSCSFSPTRANAMPGECSCAPVCQHALLGTHSCVFSVQSAQRHPAATAVAKIAMQSAWGHG